jgi:hypothetical protein
MNHDQLQAAAYQWAHNTFPQIRGHLFAVLNEVHPHPGESKKAFAIRVNQMKGIGLRKGILDLIVIMPGREQDERGAWYIPPATYGFDAKIGSDKLSEDQQKFIEVLRLCGGDGFAFYSLAEFQRIFNQLILKHYGTLNGNAGTVLP